MKSVVVFFLIVMPQQNIFAKDASQYIKLDVTEKGFTPSEIKAKSGSHVFLKVTRKTDVTCATQIKVEDKKQKIDLPLNKEVTIDLGTPKKGEIRFACGMDMLTGHIIVE